MKILFFDLFQQRQHPALFDWRIMCGELWWKLTFIHENPIHHSHIHAIRYEWFRYSLPIRIEFPHHITLARRVQSCNMCAQHHPQQHSSRPHEQPTTKSKHKLRSWYPWNYYFTWFAHSLTVNYSLSLNVPFPYHASVSVSASPTRKTNISSAETKTTEEERRN